MFRKLGYIWSLLWFCCCLPHAATGQQELAVDLQLEADPFRLASARIVIVRAIETGVIDRLDWQLGHRIQHSEILVRLRTDRLDAELRKSVGAYHAATLERQRAEALKDDNQQQIALLHWNAAVEELKNVYRKFQRQAIPSPISGVIDQIKVLPGQQVRPGQELLRLIDFSELQLRVPVNGQKVQQDSKVVVLFGDESVIGRVVATLPATERTASFAPHISNLTQAVISIPNEDQKLSLGQVGYLPVPPLALIPLSHTSKLDRIRPEIKVQNEQGDVRTIPIQIITVFSSDYALAIGPFQNGERIVQEVGAQLDDGRPVVEIVDGVTLFPDNKALMSVEQFQASMPKLSGSLPLRNHQQSNSEEVSASSAAMLNVPTKLAGIFFPEELPFAAYDQNQIIKWAGLSPIDTPFVSGVQAYYRQLARKENSVITSVRDLSETSLTAFLANAKKLNSEMLTALSAVSGERKTVEIIRARVAVLGSRILLTREGQSYLELSDTQIANTFNQYETLKQRRNELFNQFQNQEIDEATLQQQSSALLNAFKNELVTVLNQQQLQSFLKIQEDELQSSRPENSAASVEQGQEQTTEERPSTVIVTDEQNDQMLESETRISMTAIIVGAFAGILVLSLLCIFLFRNQ